MTRECCKREKGLLYQSFLLHPLYYSMGLVPSLRKSPTPPAPGVLGPSTPRLVACLLSMFVMSAYYAQKYEGKSMF